MNFTLNKALLAASSLLIANVNSSNLTTFNNSVGGGGLLGSNNNFFKSCETVSKSDTTDREKCQQLLADKKKQIDPISKKVNKLNQQELISRLKNIKNRDILPYSSDDPNKKGVNKLLTTISNRETAIEIKEILIKLFQENKNTEINKEIVNKFCAIMNNSSTEEIQKDSMLMFQVLRIGCEEQYQKSKADALTHYDDARFDFFELGDIWYKKLPDNYTYDGKDWSDILENEFRNAVVKKYIKLLTSKSTKRATDILNLMLSDTKKLDAKEEKALKVTLQLALIETNAEYCNEKINEMNQNTMLDENIKTQVRSQLNDINAGKISATNEEELKTLSLILSSSQEDVNNLQIKLTGFDYEEIQNKLDKIPALEAADKADKNDLSHQLQNIKQGNFSKKALSALNFAKKFGRDYKLGKYLDNVMKIIVQLNGYDLKKLSENSNNKTN